MDFMSWIPEGHRLLTVFLLQLGLIGFVYSWIVLGIFSVIGRLTMSLRIPGEIDTVLTVTIGHFLLTLFTTLTVFGAIEAEPLSMTLSVALGAVFLWITLSPELYEEYAGSANAQRTYSRLLFIVRLALIILWIAGLVAAGLESPELSIALLPVLSKWLRDAFSLPYFIGYLMGCIGVYTLFRSLFKALFSTFGLLGLLRDLFRAKTELEKN